MKRLDKILYLIILASGSLIIFFCSVTSTFNTAVYKNNFLYKDGLYYEKNGNDLFTGIIIDTAEVIIEFEVYNGRKNGKFTTYFLGGGIEKQGLIIDNKNEGTWKYYYENGQVETIGIFLENLPNGQWLSYHKNGKLKVSGHFREGLQIGFWSYYDQNGSFINAVSYIDNVLKDKILINI